MASANGHTRRRSMREIFEIPILLGVLTTIGLISALVGDGVWDGVSWLALSVPVAVYLVYWLRRR